MRYRLSTLLIVVSAFSMALGIYRHRADRQREAVRAIVVKGGSVAYQGVMFDELPEYLSLHDSRDPNYPSWLLDLLGRDYVANVLSASISRDQRSLRYERGLNLENRGPKMNPNYPNPAASEMIEVRDGTVEKLASLHSLVALDLAETNVADDDLMRLSQLTNLRQLRLGNAVTKRGVARLRHALPDATIEY